MNKTNLDAYIQTVIADACKEEKRPNDVKYEYVIIDNDVIFALRSSYIRVRRRIEYRLVKNLKKNFGYNFHLVLPDPMKECDECWHACDYNLYSWDNIDPNHAFMQVRFFGKTYTLTYIFGIRPQEELGEPHIEALKAHGYDYMGDRDNFECFSKAYEATYGESLMDGYKKQKTAHLKKKEEEQNNG